MDNYIMKTLVYTIADRHISYLNEICSSDTHRVARLKSLTRKSLWDKAEIHGYYTKSNIPSESDQIAMEDMWANYIECEVASYDDGEWKMN